MRKRNVHIQFWLNAKEAEKLDKKVKRSGLSREAYLRHLINDFIPRDAPPPDYFAMIRELYRVGNSLDQIAQQAHALSMIDTEKYDETVQMFNTIVRQITNTVILPQKIET